MGDSDWPMLWVLRKVGCPIAPVSWTSPTAAPCPAGSTSRSMLRSTRSSHVRHNRPTIHSGNCQPMTFPRQTPHSHPVVTPLSPWK